MIHYLLFLAVLMMAGVDAHGQEMSTIRGSLSSSIRGTITDLSGAFIRGHVSVFELQIRSGRSKLVERCSVETNKGGDYLCTSLPVGDYLLVFNPHRVSGKASSPSQGNSENGIPTFVFYPGTTDQNSARVIELKADDTQTCDVILGISNQVSISGRISASPMTATFLLYTMSGGHNLTTGTRFRYSPQSGIFDAYGIPPGAYKLSVHWYSDGAQYASEQDLIVGDRDVHGIAVVATQNAAIVGKVTADRVQTGVFNRLILYSKDPTLPNQSAEVKADGTFSFESVPMASYVLMTTGAGGACVASTTINGQYQTGQEVQVPQGPMTISLGVNAVQCSGAIRGSIDVEGADPSRVLIVVESESSGATLTLQVDHTGKFEMSGIPPGDYRLYAWQRDSNVEYSNPQFLRRYKQESSEVSVTEGEIADDVQLLPIPPPS
jgi:hypothetical protein